MTLTKAEMVEQLHDELGLNNREAKEIVEQIFEEMRAALTAGESVKVVGFGVFNLRDKTSRVGRNPKTGEKTLISARRVVTFHAGRVLRKRVESAMGRRAGRAA